MLVVKVELWPGGRGGEHAKELCRAYISNDGKTSNATSGEYGAYDAKFMQSTQYNPDKVWKKGRVDKMHRKRRGVWDILYVALRSAGMGKRNPE